MIIFNLNNRLYIYGQREKENILLGSKTLGLNVLELHYVMLANHD